MPSQTHAHADEKVLTQNGPNPYWHHPMYRVSQNDMNIWQGSKLPLAHQPWTTKFSIGQPNVMVEVALWTSANFGYNYGTFWYVF